jgi:glutathione S-transferase
VTEVKLYDFAPAPSAQRVHIFLAEKGIRLETVEVKVREGEQFKEPFTTLNPWHCVPFLETDDGDIIAESISICRYLDELHPEPSLFGATAGDRGRIDMWNRRLELDAFVPALHAVRNGNPNFAGRVVPGTRNDLAQLPAIVSRGKEMLAIMLARVEAQLANHEFVAGDAFSIADITGYFVGNMAAGLGVDVAGNYPAIHRWHETLKQRPAFAS